MGGEEGGRTTEGIDICGQLLVNEINAFLLRESVCFMSFIGHSMGGLICRFAVGILREQNVFNRIKPVNFITLATPHLGTRKLANKYERWYHPIVNYSISSWPLGKTGKQMVLEDCEEPLLLLMAQPHEMFFQALGRFDRLATYSNVYDDFIVPYSTAAISAFNPYRVQNDFDGTHEYPLIIHKPQSIVPIEGTFSPSSLPLSPSIVPFRSDDRADSEAFHSHRRAPSASTFIVLPSSFAPPPTPTRRKNVPSKEGEKGGGEKGKGGGGLAVERGSMSKSSSESSLVAMEGKSKKKRPLPPPPKGQAPLEVPPQMEALEDIELDDDEEDDKKKSAEHHVLALAPSDQASQHSYFHEVRDEKSGQVQKIYDALQSLHWDRFDVLFYMNPLAHEDIIAKRKSVLPKVPRHLADHFLYLPLSE